MSWFLYTLWPYLAGGLIAWLVCGRLAHKLKYQPAPRERIVEKVVERIVEVEVAPAEARAAVPVSGEHDASADTDGAGTAVLSIVGGEDLNRADREADDTALQAARMRVAELEAQLSALVPEVDVARAANAGFRLQANDGVDDLTAIEGIGPKIRDLLQGAGLGRFADLANADVVQIRQLLAEAGPAFGLARPDTWPAQAALAAHNHWEALKAWQDVLDGGEETKS